MSNQPHPRSPCSLAPWLLGSSARLLAGGRGFSSFPTRQEQRTEQKSASFKTLTHTQPGKQEETHTTHKHCQTLRPPSEEPVLEPSSTLRKSDITKAAGPDRMPSCADHPAEVFTNSLDLQQRLRSSKPKPLSPLCPKHKQ